MTKNKDEASYDPFTAKPFATRTITPNTSYAPPKNGFKAPEWMPKNLQSKPVSSPAKPVEYDQVALRNKAITQSSVNNKPTSTSGSKPVASQPTAKMYQPTGNKEPLFAPSTNDQVRKRNQALTSASTLTKKDTTPARPSATIAAPKQASAVSSTAKVSQSIQVVPINKNPTLDHKGVASAHDEMFKMAAAAKTAPLTYQQTISAHDEFFKGTAMDPALNKTAPKKPAVVGRSATVNSTPKPSAISGSAVYKKPAESSSVAVIKPAAAAAAKPAAPKPAIGGPLTYEQTISAHDEFFKGTAMDPALNKTAPKKPAVVGGGSAAVIKKPAVPGLNSTNLVPEPRKTTAQITSFSASGGSAGGAAVKNSSLAGGSIGLVGFSNKSKP